MKSKVFVTLLLLTLGACKTSEFTQKAFGLLGEISKKQIQELLMQNNAIWTKDSINVSANVLRSKCRSVLGKRLNAWVTNKGQASLDKKDLYASLSWEVLKDTSKVRMNFVRVLKK